MVNPSKIIEGGTVYSLGELDGKKVDYDFTKILCYLECQGQTAVREEFPHLGGKPRYRVPVERLYHQGRGGLRKARH